MAHVILIINLVLYEPFVDVYVLDWEQNESLSRFL